MDMLDYFNSSGGTALMLAYERMITADQPMICRTRTGGLSSLRARTGMQEGSGCALGPMPRPFPAPV